jgi:hypothetical protein
MKVKSKILKNASLYDAYLIFECRAISEDADGTSKSHWHKYFKFEGQGVLSQNVSPD